MAVVHLAISVLLTTIDQSCLLGRQEPFLPGPRLDAVTLSPEDYYAWLDPKNADADELQSLLAPYPAEEMTMRPMSTRVNSPRNDEPECVEGMTEGA